MLFGMFSCDKIQGVYCVTLHKAELSSDKLISVAEKLQTSLPAGGSEP